MHSYAHTHTHTRSDFDKKWHRAEERLIACSFETILSEIKSSCTTSSFLSSDRKTLTLQAQCRLSQWKINIVVYNIFFEPRSSLYMRSGYNKTTCETSKGSISSSAGVEGNQGQQWLSN